MADALHLRVAVCVLQLGRIALDHLNHRDHACGLAQFQLHILAQFSHKRQGEIPQSHALIRDERNAKADQKVD